MTSPLEPASMNESAPQGRLTDRQVRVLMQIAHKWAGPDENDSRSDDLEMALRAARLAALPLPAVVQAAPGDVHPAAPQTTVPTAAPRSEPRALGQGELPVRALYDELLFAVGSKFPDETRHQTALRYIRNAEKSCDSCAAMSAPGGGGRA